MYRLLFLNVTFMLQVGTHSCFRPFKMTYYSHFNGNTTISLYWIHSSTLHLSHLVGESHNSSILILGWEPVMVSPSNTNLTHFIKSNSRGAAFPVHSMKIYSSRGMASLSFNFGTRWRWMVNFTPMPLYPCGRTYIPIELEGGWAPEPFWTFQWKLFLLPIFKLLTAEPIA